MLYASGRPTNKLQVCLLVKYKSIQISFSILLHTISHIISLIFHSVSFSLKFLETMSTNSYHLLFIFQILNKYKSYLNMIGQYPTIYQCKMQQKAGFNLSNLDITPNIMKMTAKYDINKMITTQTLTFDTCLFPIY